MSKAIAIPDKTLAPEAAEDTYYREPSEQQKAINDDRLYAFDIALGTFLLAHNIFQGSPRGTRRDIMERVLRRKAGLIRETFRELAGGLCMGETLSPVAVEQLLGKNVPQDQSLTFVIDLIFSHPFAPYKVSFSHADFIKALITTASYVHVESRTINGILDTKKAAEAAHNSWSVSRVALYVLSGMAILGTGGYLVAPLIGTVIGNAAGLYGAAATAHGLAILGGGSLSLGGFGMAGGMWLVSGTGALMGGGAAALLEIGAPQATQELVKLQVTYKEVLLRTQGHVKKAQEAIIALKKQMDELKHLLADERQLNEGKAVRVKNAEKTLEALKTALKWIEECETP